MKPSKKKRTTIYAEWQDKRICQICPDKRTCPLPCEMRATWIAGGPKNDKYWNLEKEIDIRISDEKRSIPNRTGDPVWSDDFVDGYIRPDLSL